MKQQPISQPKEKWLNTRLSIVSFIAVLLSGCLFFSSCKKELDAPTLQPLETGELTASKPVVAIDAASPGSEAVSFSWTSFTNSRIDNRMVISAAGKTDTVAVAKNVTTRRFNNGELNTILVDVLELPVGTESDVMFTLLAVITNTDKVASSNVVSIRITPVPTGPPYEQLWIVGDATPNGWDIDNPNQMVVDPTNPFQFKYGAVLNAGEFKIPVSTGDWGTDFFMPPANNPDITSTAVQLMMGGQPDNKWRITTPGAYKILLNISSSPFINIKPFTAYAGLWMVGDATPAGWNIDAPTPMTMTVGNPYEFTYTGALTAGEFKIPVGTGNWNGDFFMPSVNGAGAGTSPALFVPGGNPDWKWKITEAGNYKVTINQLTETISIVKQ